MSFLIALLVVVNVIAILFFAALYSKRIKLDNYKKAAEKFDVSRFSKSYLSV